VNIEGVLGEIVETDRLEGKMEAGSSYWDCLRGINTRRTEIAVGVYAIQVLCGTYLVGFSTYFFTRKFVRGCVVCLSVLMVTMQWQVYQRMKLLI
jgi:hypothetical protein